MDSRSPTAARQELQEEEYSFPYHYICEYAGGQFRPFVFDAWAINYASTIEYLLERLTSTPLSRVVDVGCGDGRFSRDVALSLRDAAVVGVDYSDRAVALAQALNRDVANLRFECRDVTMPWSVERFDVAVLMEVLEHVPPRHVKAFLAGVRSLLRDGGTLYVTVPHDNKPVEDKHFQHFTSDGIRDCLEADFVVEEIVPFERMSVSRIWLEKALCNTFFLLRSPRALKWAYQWYKAHLFECQSERECQRLFVRASAR